MYFKTNNTARIYIIGVSLSNVPQHKFITTYESIPIIIPAEIE